jgi:hypothetical protein
MSYSDYAESQPFVNEGPGPSGGYLFDPVKNELEQLGDLTIYRVSGSVVEGGIQAGFDFSTRIIAPALTFLQGKVGGIPIWIYFLVVGVAFMVMRAKRR